MLPQLLSGARVTLKINADVIAAAHVLDYSIETRHVPHEGIDYVLPNELMPERINVTMSLKVYRAPDSDPVKAGYIPGANNVGQVEQTSFSDSSYIRVEVMDDSNNVVLVLPKAVIVRRSGGVAIGDFLTESWGVMGIGYYGSNPA